MPMILARFVSASDESGIPPRLLEIPAVPRTGEVVYFDAHGAAVGFRVASVCWTPTSDDEDVVVVLRLPE